MKWNNISEIPFNIWIVLIITLWFIVMGFNDLLSLINWVPNFFLGSAWLRQATTTEWLYRLLVPLINILLLVIFWLKVYNRKKDAFRWLIILIFFQTFLLFKDSTQLFADLQQRGFLFLQFLIYVLWPYFLYLIVSYLLAAPYIRWWANLASSGSSLEGSVSEDVSLWKVKPVRWINRATFYRRLFLIGFMVAISSFYLLKSWIREDDAFGIDGMATWIMFIMIVILLLITSLIILVIYEQKTKKRLLSQQNTNQNILQKSETNSEITHQREISESKSPLKIYLTVLIGIIGLPILWSNTMRTLDNIASPYSDSEGIMWVFIIGMVLSTLLIVVRGSSIKKRAKVILYLIFSIPFILTTIVYVTDTREDIKKETTKFTCQYLYENKLCDTSWVRNKECDNCNIYFPKRNYSSNFMNALETDNYKLCDTNHCLSTYAIIKSDLNACLAIESIKDGSEDLNRNKHKIDCLLHIAYKNNDTSICKHLHNLYDDKVRDWSIRNNREDICLKNVPSYKINELTPYDYKAREFLEDLEFPFGKLSSGEIDSLLLKYQPFIEKHTVEE
jgi:uncharacterized membrane protein